jgi:hypothetical protein
MTIPTWLTLKNLKCELKGVAKQTAESLGDVLGEDKGNSELNDLRFYVGF